MTSSDGGLAADERDVQLSRSLAAVRQRIDDACRSAVRGPDEVKLVVVTKTYPATDVARLHALGVADVGENKDQEASAKKAELDALMRLPAMEQPAGPLRWHMVGRLQSNKARSVAQWADVVHSVDRVALVGALDAGASRAERTLEVLIQVSLDGARNRGGVEVSDALALAARVAESAALHLRGVMAVAPIGADPRSAFEQLAAVSDRFVAEHPDARWISAGMSGDLEAAIEAGATHVRIGSAVLGQRPALG